MAANTITRFTPGKNQDNTFRTATRDYQTPAYAATIALAPLLEYTLVKPAQLTGALTLTATADTNQWVGDVLEFLFATDATQRIVTFGTGFLSVGTLTIPASKTAYARFMFNGTAWVECTRTAIGA